MRLADKIVDVLQQNPEQMLTGREIAAQIWETDRQWCEDKIARSQAPFPPVKDRGWLIKQVAAEVGITVKDIQRKDPRIQIGEGKPRKFYFTEKTDEEESQQDTLTERADATETESSAAAVRQFTEHDLYPLLAQFLDAEFTVHSKRIDERKSKNNRGPRGNRWLYPDLVGLEDLGSDWDAKIKDCAKEYGDKKANLWSFEVKLRLNRANVREAFFQAVSNSAWANFGYLVAAEINNNAMQELQMLSNLHGIGVIRLNTESPTDSEHLLQAEEREVDWSSVNRLADQNEDFENFVELVTNFHKTDKIYPRQWDAPPLDDD